MYMNNLTMTIFSVATQIFPPLGPLPNLTIKHTLPNLIVVSS